MPLLTRAPCPQRPALVSTHTHLPPPPGSLNVPAGVISAGGIRTLEEKELYIGISACELGDSELTRRRCRD